MKFHNYTLMYKKFIKCFIYFTQVTILWLMYVSYARRVTHAMLHTQTYALPAHTVKSDKTSVSTVLKVRMLNICCQNLKNMPLVNSECTLIFILCSYPSNWMLCLQHHSYPIWQLSTFITFMWFSFNKIVNNTIKV